EHVKLNLKSSLALQTRNERFELTVFKFFGFTAVGTDEMMGMSLRGGNITVAAVVEMNALDVAELGQQFERAIDGDESEMGIFFARAFVNLGGREMVFCRGDNFKHGLARAGEFATVLTQTVAHSGCDLWCHSN